MRSSRRRHRNPPPVLKAGAAVNGARLFRQGFFTSAANPKAVFFFAALFPQFIAAAALLALKAVEVATRR